MASFFATFNESKAYVGEEFVMQTCGSCRVWREIVLYAGSDAVLQQSGNVEIYWFRDTEACRAY